MFIVYLVCLVFLSMKIDPGKAILPYCVEFLLENNTRLSRISVTINVPFSPSLT